MQGEVGSLEANARLSGEWATEALTLRPSWGAAGWRHRVVVAESNVARKWRDLEVFGGVVVARVRHGGFVRLDQVSAVSGRVTFPNDCLLMQRL